MEAFSALLAICAGNSPVPGEFPAQRPVTRSFDVFFDLRPNKQLSKQRWGWWFETPSWSLWRHRNGDRRDGCISVADTQLKFHLFSWLYVPLIFSATDTISERHYILKHISVHLIIKYTYFDYKHHEFGLLYAVIQTEVTVNSLYYHVHVHSWVWLIHWV